jgi:peptidoglycan biosynthesis protein MviN/MurJ (putative lipid II flippase)
LAVVASGDRLPRLLRRLALDLPGHRKRAGDHRRTLLAMRDAGAVVLSLTAACVCAGKAVLLLVRSRHSREAVQGFGEIVRNPRLVAAAYLCFAAGMSTLAVLQAVRWDRSIRWAGYLTVLSLLVACVVCSIVAAVRRPGALTRRE